MSESTTGRPDRTATRRLTLHSLDALRGFMLAMVVLGHAAVSFGVNCRENVWKACDDSTSYLLFPRENFVLDLWGLTMFGACIPTFFMLAGLYAMAMYKKTGAPGFIVNRIKFIVLPFLAGCLLIVPFSQLAGLYGDAWKAEPGSPKADFAESATRFFTTTDYFQYFSLGHLWFLYYLLLCYVAFVVTAPLWDPLMRATRLRAGMARLLDSRLRVLLLAIPTALLMLPMKTVIDTPTGQGWQAFAVRWDILAYYYFFFLLGGMLARQPRLIPKFWRRWLPHLLIALVVVLPATLLLLVLSVLTPGQYERWIQWMRLPQFLVAFLRPVAAGTGEWGGAHVLMLVSYAVYNWLLMFGIYGFFNRFFGRPRPWVRYVVESSYWLYLAHFPVVIALQVAVQDLALPPLLKYLGVTAVTLALLFGSFELVRPTPLGRLLGARPRRRAGRPAPRRPPT